jgi:hypothetical protein
LGGRGGTAIAAVVANRGTRVARLEVFMVFGSADGWFFTGNGRMAAGGTTYLAAHILPYALRFLLMARIFFKFFKSLV